jgi:Tfp pilus assembly protein PilF
MSGHIVYGQALYESGRADEAKAVFETALSLDPENLIALRHLGDIARTAGDPAGARGWYQRVLDADPRNEEIIELLTSLDSGEPGVARAANPAASSRSTPLRTETIAHEGQR